MAEQFGMMPDALRGVAGDVGDIGSEVAEVMASLRAQIGGEAADAACAITHGDAASFWTSYGGLAQNVESLAGTISQVADDLGWAANIFGQFDQGSAVGA
jgi:uncharacterized protein YukE